MEISFYKYQGTGNDFVLLDNRDGRYDALSSTQIAWLCDRRFGVGGDGLMLLQNKEGFDFEMVYFNADGQDSSMCGNGGRCLVAFANFLGILDQPKAYFLAVDGPHEAVVVSSAYIELKMSPVNATQYGAPALFLDTGSPHHLAFVPNLDEINVYEQGQEIRYSAPYKAAGTNVNFIEIKAPNQLYVATYERGVEGETLSCGTGVTAAALAYQLSHRQQTSSNAVKIQTKGGNLTVRYSQIEQQFKDIWLCGPAQQVFKGQLTLSVSSK
ncbi:MAG: diaminopimelate epimerase [Aureispira sp.]